jgi:hypothetical protein
MSGTDLARLAARLRTQLGPQGAHALAELLTQPAEPPPPAAKAEAPPSFADRIIAQLGPILARADEKADLLIEALTAAGHDLADVTPRGLKPTIARLVARCGEAAVQQGADLVIARAKAFGALRETVV